MTINNLMPGLFDTDRLRVGLGVQARAAGQSLETYFVQKRDGSVAGRFGHSDEFGAFCAFLCSAHAGYIVGQNLLIDGGAFPGTF